MVNWAKNTRTNSSGYSPAQWVIGRGYKLPWSLLDEKQSGELASLELPDHSPEFSRRTSWLWAARRAFATMGHQSSIQTCAVCRCSSQCSHPGDRERRTGLCLAEGQEKQKRRADRTCFPSVVWSSYRCWQREEQRARVLSRSCDGGCTSMPP